MRIVGATSAKTVGRTQLPTRNISPAGRSPPVINLAPSCLPLSMKPITLRSWPAEFSGPISLSSLIGSPTRNLETRSVTASSTRSWMSAWTSRRLVEPQDWPCQVKFIPATAAAAISSGSLSGNTIIGFLPPSSSETCLTQTSAAARWIARPVSTDPMKAMRLISGWRTIASPTVRPRPVTMLKMPGGRLVAAISARSIADNGLVFRRFHDDRVARRQRGGRSGYGKHQRMIEWHDASDNAVRLAQRDVKVIGRRRYGFAFHLMRNAGVIFEAVDGMADVGAHRLDRVATVGNLDLEDFLGSGHQVGPEFVDDFGPLLDRRARPVGPCRLSGLDSAIDVLLGTRRHPTNRLFIGGIDTFVPLAARALDELAADQHVVGFGYVSHRKLQSFAVPLIDKSSADAASEIAIQIGG